MNGQDCGIFLIWNGKYYFKASPKFEAFEAENEKARQEIEAIFTHQFIDIAPSASIINMLSFFEKGKKNCQTRREGDFELYGPLDEDEKKVLTFSKQA